MSSELKEIITKRLRKTCAGCGRKINVILYEDKSYRGGHYFGKIPLYTDREFEKAHSVGTTKERFGKVVIEVLKKDPKPYAHAEYWECQSCYW